MLQFLKVFLKLLLLTILVTGQFVSAWAQQDCFDAINVCSPSYTQANAFAGSGGVSEIPSGSSCLGNGESNSVWYIFSIITPGQLTFQLTPNVATDDYDFVVYNITSDSCIGITNGTNAPISCNYSAAAGSTGLSSGSSITSAGSSDPNQCAPLTVVAGQTFALMVSNFTSSQSGYQLDFGGTASIVDQNPPSVSLVDQDGQCSPTQVFLEMNEPIACGTVQFSGGDFSISGPQAVSILSATTIGCNAEGFSTTVRLVFSGALSTPGTYAISVTNGVGGSTVEDFCGNAIPTGSLTTFDVTSPGPVVTVGNVVNTNCGQANGSANVNIQFGAPPYNISWSTGTNQGMTSINGLGPGTYFVTVGDQNGCTANGNFSISNTDAHTINGVNVVGATCNNSTDGSAEVQVNGGSGNYSITWNTNPAQTGTTANNLPGGNVNVTVTDLNSGCVVSSNINISRPAPISIPVSTVQPGCGASDGQATANPTGGNGGYTYNWNTAPVQTTATATELAASVYNVTVTDQLGCNQSTTVLITDDNPPAASITSTTPDCQQGTGSASALASTGAAPHSYQWNTNPPQIGATATNLAGGDYFVTITDANGCVQIINVKIDSIPPPQIAVSEIQPTCGQSDGELSASVTSGTAPYTFEWQPSGNTLATETGLSEGVYTVVVTDDIGCVDTVVVELEQLLPVSNITITSACLGEPSTFSFATNSGATNLVWDFGDGTTSTDQSPVHTYESSGDFEVTLQLTGGCLPDLVSDTASVYEPPVSSFFIDPEIPTTRTEVSFIYNGSGGTQFLWDFDDGETSNEVRPDHLFAIDGPYDIHLTVIDANGCVDTVTQTIEVLLQPVIYLPNAFMPDGTPENSVFKGYGIGLTSAELSVFNRWGTLLYYSNDMNEILTTGWDGSFNGKPAQQGVYPYKIKTTFYNNNSFEKLGTVTLIR